MTTMRTKLLSFFSSRVFYLIAMGLFVFESVWIAFSALYPQAFDENFHFGLIQIYSHYWLPFLSHQPANAAAYGAVARDPSYLYHYLLSFPYRLLSLGIHGQMGQVIALRLLNIGLVVAGLVLFRRVLIRAGLSKSFISVALLLFALLPIAPQLAAQINYDNLLFLLVAWVCLLTFTVIEQFERRKVSVRSLTTLLAVCLFTSLVKYAFLPIFLSVVLFLGLVVYQRSRHDLTGLLKLLVKDFTAQSRWLRVGLVAILVLPLGLLMQRDGVNVLHYHSVVPNCSKVLSIHSCSQYSAWQVDYARHQQVTAGSVSASYNLFTYTRLWFYYMWYRLFFAVNGPASNFANSPPLPLPSIAAIVIALVGVIAFLRYGRRVFRKNPYVSFLFMMSSIYGASLFLKGYATYHYTAVLENENGRYLLPILLPLCAVAGLTISLLLAKKNNYKPVFASLAILLFLSGGGLLTFIVRSDPTWDWPTQNVVNLNNAARTVAKHVVYTKNFTTRD